MILCRNLSEAYRFLFWCLFGAARTSVEVVLLVPLLVLSGPAIPNTRTFLSCSVAPEMQSRALSAFSAIEALCTLVAPVFSGGYTYTVKAGLPFLMFEVMGCLTLVSFILILWVSQREQYSRNIPIATSFVVAEKVAADFRFSRDLDFKMDAHKADTYMLLQPLQPHVEATLDHSNP